MNSSLPFHNKIIVQLLVKYLSVSSYFHIYLTIFYINQVVCSTRCFFNIFSVVVINSSRICSMNRIFTGSGNVLKCTSHEVKPTYLLE